MLISRGINLLNHISKCAKRKSSLTNLQPTRFSHSWGYRPYPNPPRNWIIATEIAGAFGWWWVLYRLFYDYKQFGGHGEYPDVSKWTDEELGIPPDGSN